MRPVATRNEAEVDGKELSPEEGAFSVAEGDSEKEQNIQPSKIDLVKVLPKLQALLGTLRELKKRRDATDDGTNSS